MSLDVYLRAPTHCPNCNHLVGGGETVFDSNVTHNLGRMASEAGIYEVLWRPEEFVSPDIATVLHDAEKAKGYWHEETQAIRAQMRNAVARELIEPMRAGLALLKSDPDRFRKFDAPNGWGLYEHFVPWVERYLEACEANPNAIVEVSR